MGGASAEVRSMLYEAAVIPEKWPSALDALGKVGGG